MNYHTYISILEEQTAAQPYAEQAQFALMICKKLFIEYKKFVDKFHWGNTDLLMDAINLCQVSMENNTDMERVKDFLIQIEPVIPHMDDYGGDYQASYALNAGAAVYETLEFLTDRDRLHIYNIATYYTDTIDFKIQEERDLTEAEIENHPLMIEAWNFIIAETKKGI